MSELPFMAKWRNAVRDSDLPRTAKLVAHTLSTYMDADGRTGPETRQTPSIVALARGASLGRRTQKDNTAVKDAIARLELAGFLIVDRRRGQRGWTYSARIPRAYEGFESPARTRDSAERIPRADVNESPAKTSGIPRRDGGEVEESERESDDVDVGEVDEGEENPEELADVLAPLGSFMAEQFAEVEPAWTEKPAGVRALVDDVRASRGVRNPVGLFMARLRQGNHLTIKVEPAQTWAQAPLEPCEECGQEFGHATSCSYATPGAHDGVCPECGVGGGLHAEGFPCTAQEEAA